MKDKALIVFFLTLFSCQKEKEEFQWINYSKDFSIVQLTGSKIELENQERFPLDPVCLVMEDSILALGNMSYSQSDSVYTFIDIKNGRIIRNFGIMGRGPQEGLNCYLNMSKKRRHFDFYGMHNFNRISIDSILNSSETIYQTLVDFSKVERPEGYGEDPISHHPQWAFNFNDTLFVAKGYYSAGVYGLYDRQLKNKGFYLEYPDHGKNDFTTQEKSLVYANGHLKFHPTKDLFVCPFSGSDGFEICEIDTIIPSIKRVAVAYTYLPVYVRPPSGYGAAFSKKSKLGIVNSATGEKFIYVMKVDKTFEESMKDNRVDYNSDEIFTYTWDGKPHTKYKLDLPVRAFTVDVEDKVIYAIVENPGPVLYKYDLPG